MEHGSFTGAAAALGYAQPSISEQIRTLEQSLGVTLFRRLGRGVAPTDAALSVRPAAEQVIRAFDEVRHAARATRELTTGTVRFGMFGTARLYFGAQIIADLLDRHPGIRVELVGQNSTEVATAVQNGELEAGVVALPIDDDGLELEPLLHDELVYVSTTPERVARPVTATALADAQLVLSEASWGNQDSTRRQLARRVQEVGGTLRTRVEVEDVETAIEVAGLGLADAIVARGVLHSLGNSVPDTAGWAPLEPPLTDTFALAHRRGVTPSRAAVVVMDLIRTHLDRLRHELDTPRR
jgi:DNA-binding transcriptional LysR family regulator